MKVAFVAILAAGIPVCFFGILCIFYRLYCKRERKKDIVLLGQGRKLWRKSYEMASSSPESLTIPKHAPKIMSKFIQDSPQLSSTSTSTRISPPEDSPCLTEEDEDDNSSQSNYRTAPDDVISPGNASVDSRNAIELISLNTNSDSEAKDSIFKARESTERTKNVETPSVLEPRKIPTIRVVDENKDVLFKLEVDGANSMHTEKVARREEKIPVNLSSSIFHKNRNACPSLTNLGKLNVSLLYKQSTCELFLKVNKAFNLPVKDLRNNTSSPFVRLYVLPSRRYNYSTKTISKSVNPAFNECFVIGGLTLMEILQLTIHFLVIHHEPIQRNVVLGELMVPLVNYEFVDEEVTISQNLKVYKPQPVLGELQVSVCHQPLANKLSLTIVQARNLPKISNFGIGDPYVKVELFFNSRRIFKKKTRTKKRTTNPRFMQTFTFELQSPNVLLESVILVMTVLVLDPGGCHEKVGQVVLSSMTEGPAAAQWNEVFANPHIPIERWQMIYE